MAEVIDSSGEYDALGLKPQRRLDSAAIAREFPDSSSDLRMVNFNPQMYLLENHGETSYGLKMFLKTNLTITIFLKERT